MPENITLAQDKLTAKPKPKTPESKEAIKMLYMELGPSEAARRLGKPINTLTKWASRYGWVTHVKAIAERAKPSVVTVVKPSEAIADSIKEHGEVTKGALAKVVREVADRVCVEDLPVRSLSHLKDLTTTASRVFGWDIGQAKGDTYNTLVISPEQLDQIRALRAPAETITVEA